MRARRRHESGITFLLTLFMVAALGLGLASFGTVWATTAQRERETELIFIGGEFARALAHYKAQSPGVYPLTLQELVGDTRVPFPRRFLRKLYRDPMSGKADWQEVRIDGRIVGVHSRSDKTALRTATLPPWVKLLDAKDRVGGQDGFKAAIPALSPAGEGGAQYRDWLFRPEEPGQPGAAALPVQPGAAQAPTPQPLPGVTARP